MKVILLTEVPKVGHKFDVKDVSDGYAQNYLLPRNLAEVATKKKLAALTAQKEEQKEEQVATREQLKKDLAKLSGKVIEMQAKANEQGHLFQGLHKKDVVQALAKQEGVHLPENLFVFEEPIKEVGDHVITVEADGNKNTFTLEVKANTR